MTAHEGGPSTVDGPPSCAVINVCEWGEMVRVLCVAARELEADA